MSHVLKLLRKWFFTGLLVWAPFVGTIALFVWAFNLLDGWVQPYAQQYLKHRVPGLGLAILLLTTFTIGAIVSNFIGKRLVTIIENFLLRVPGFNVIYKLFRDLSGTFLNRDSKGGFREVVAIRFPSPATWAVGFITGPVPPPLAALDGEDKVLVFIMQAFSPATGFLIAIPRKDTFKLDIPVDEAIKMILTGGLVKNANAESTLPPAA